jgi:hypothetical protein
MTMKDGQHLRRHGGEQRSHQGGHCIKGGGGSAGNRGVDGGGEPVEFLRHASRRAMQYDFEATTVRPSANAAM